MYTWTNSVKQPVILLYSYLLIITALIKYLYDIHCHFNSPEVV